ncbi:beta-lactamase/transpeptidase-like protein [Aspergillus karnatakaensis]|uniref:serine hydrolase domain-containing protein n=1 Tax=Aspergillus karnatakaensis TaxID=1810916 RepID=UPI003CCD342A
MSKQRNDSCAISRRLHGCVPHIDEIRQICQTPSIVFGVIHEGKVVFEDSVGYRNAEQTLKPDADTIYMIGSCSKMFTSAAVGILVDEGKLQWQDPVQKYLPEFDPHGDPRIGQTADIIDLLRHSSGVVDPSELIFGPRGSILVDGNDMFQLLNAMPTTDEKGQRFNREWGYNNVTYGMVAMIVERVSGQRFADFVEERLLGPLGMNRTAMKRGRIMGDDNVAVPCLKLSNGQFVAAESESWPCDRHTPLLAATGMRSSLNDMLIWCTAVMSAERHENKTQSEDIETQDDVTCSQSFCPPRFHPHNNPLKQMNRIRRGYWTRPCDDREVSKDAAYCMGWVRMELPSSMMGSFSGNIHTRENPHRLHLKHIMGMENPSFLMVGHTGGMSGSIATVWTFPETQSAVVAMTNGRDLGDASDFAAQTLIQALFDLTPRVDFTSWAMKEAQLACNHFPNIILKPWLEDRRPNEAGRDPMCYVGEYRGINGLFALRISADSNRKLSVLFNNHELSKCPLVFFGRDTYSYLLEDYDSWTTMVIWAKSYKKTIFEFDVGSESTKASGLWWRWYSDEPASWFSRIQ